jgi:hypothetical protein
MRQDSQNVPWLQLRACRIREQGQHGVRGRALAGSPRGPGLVACGHDDADGQCIGTDPWQRGYFPASASPEIIARCERLGEYVYAPLSVNGRTFVGVVRRPSVDQRLNQTRLAVPAGRRYDDRRAIPTDNARVDERKLTAAARQVGPQLAFEGLDGEVLILRLRDKCAATVQLVDTTP